MLLPMHLSAKHRWQLHDGLLMCRLQVKHYGVQVITATTCCANISRQNAGCYIQKPLQQAKAPNCKQGTRHTLMMAFLPMRDLSPMMAFSTLHSSRKAP